MKKTLSLFALACTILFGACHPKKEDPTPVDPPAEEYVRGTMSTTWIKSVGDDSLLASGDTIGLAAFFDAHGNSIEVTSVSLNNVKLGPNSPGKDYITSDVKEIASSKWDTKGNNGIPDFSYTYTASMPSYSGYKTLPKTVERSKPLTITLTGLKNADFFVISVYDAHGVSISTEVIDVKTTTTATIPASQLTTLNADSYLSVAVFNHHMETFGGLDFGFEKEMSYYKPISIN